MRLPGEARLPVYAWSEENAVAGAAGSYPAIQDSNDDRL
jgi:hypothetical protein